MNENYLKYFNTTSPYGTFNDPFQMSFEMDSESVIERLKALLKVEDITFLKKEGIKPMEFVKSTPDVLTLNWDNCLSSEDVERLKTLILESLRVPTSYIENTAQSNYLSYSDEYH